MNPDILDKILRAIIVFLQVGKLGCTNSSWKRVKESFTRLGKQDSLPRIPRYCRQSNQASMPCLIASSTLSRRQLLMICLILSRVPDLIAVDAVVSTVPGTVTLVQSPLSTPALPASAIQSLP